MAKHTSTRQTEIRVRFCKDPQIEEFQYAGIEKSKDALKNQDMWRVDGRDRI